MSLQNAQADFADLMLELDTPDDLISPLENIIIYQNNHYTHLARALLNTYPLIATLVGKHAFRVAARDYIEQYPSRTGDLNEYGEYFSDFIRQYEPANELVYLGEVAQFEWACHQISLAADASSLDIRQLQTIPPDDQPDLLFVLNPASYLLQCRYPLMQIIDLCKGDISHIENIETSITFLLILRRHNEIVLTPLNHADFVFLETLQQGLPLGIALDYALELNPDFDLDEKMTHWVKNSVITDVVISVD